MFSESKRQKIADILTSKGATGICSRCGAREHQLLDGYFRLESQESFQKVVLGGPSIPAYGIMCTNCGMISFHAVGIVTPDELNNQQ